MSSGTPEAFFELRVLCHTWLWYSFQAAFIANCFLFSAFAASSAPRAFGRYAPKMHTRSVKILSASER